VKLILKETVERYHVIDLDDSYDIDAFIDDVANLSPIQGIEAVEEMLEDMRQQYGTEYNVEHDKAGMETTALEIIDEYDE